MEGMTRLSSEMFDAALNIENLDDAYSILKKYSYYHRSPADILHKFYTGDDLQTALCEGLAKWKPQLNNKTVKDNISNWLANGIPDKENAFFLSRILHLGLDDTDLLLKMLVSEGIHWRNPKDIAWAYAASHDYTPEQFTALIAKISAMGDTPAPSETPTQFSVDIEPALRYVLPGTEEDLMHWLTEEWANLGKYHDFAFVVCNALLAQLTNPYNESEEVQKTKHDKIVDELNRFNKKRAAEFKLIENEFKNKEENDKSEEELARLRYEHEKIPVKYTDPRFQSYLSEHHPGHEYLFASVENILVDYMYRRLIPFKGKARDTAKKYEHLSPEDRQIAMMYEKRYIQGPEFNEIQKIIRESWPESTAVSNIKNRKKDVTRKMLLLLFLVTNGIGTDYESTMAPEKLASLSTEDAFFEKYYRIEEMLAELGYQGLDARNPFDWIILFCLSTDASEGENDRMTEMLARIFPIE